MSLGHSGRAASPDAGDARVLVVVPVPRGRLADAGRTLASLDAQRDERPDVVLVVPQDGPDQDGSDQDGPDQDGPDQDGPDQGAAAGAGELPALAERLGARVVADPGRGLAAAVQAGLATASEGHRYVSWLGVHDVLLPGALRVAAAALDADPDAALAFGDCRYEASDGDYLLTVHTGSQVRRLVGVGFDPPATCATLFRLSALVAAGGLDEDLRYAMDLDLVLRLRRHGRFVATGRTHAVFRAPDTAVGRATTAAAVAETRAVLTRHAPEALRPLMSAWRAPVRFSGHRPLPAARRAARWAGES